MLNKITHLKAHNEARDSEWYKKLKSGDVYYDVFGQTVRELTYLGYYVQGSNTWIVNANGVTKLGTNMYPYFEREIMLDRIFEVKVLKVNAEIQSLQSRLDELNSEKFAMHETNRQDWYADNVSNLSFKCEPEVAKEFLIHYPLDGITETNIDFLKK